jgi:hypothetical protein
MMHKSQMNKILPDSTSRKHIELDKNLTKLNKHINFSKEITKSSARKWPTEVTCCKCKKRFVLPFKPRKPEVYCDDCFKLKNQEFKLKNPKFNLKKEEFKKNQPFEKKNY